MLAPKCSKTIQYAISLSCALLIFGFRAFAMTLYVDSDYGSDSNNGATENTALRTLGTAVTVVQWVGEEENTIFVAPGIYTDESNRNMVLYGVNLDIIATGSAGSSVIDLQQSGNFLTIDTGANATIQNLTIQNGHSSLHSAAAIDVIDGSLTALDCSIRDSSGPGEVVYAENGTLIMQNCFVDGYSDSDDEYQSASISSSSADVALLNCTLTGDGLVLSSYGETTLNNTIIDGESQLPYSASANNCYAWDDLSDLGSGNIQGTSPGLDEAGVISESSPCASTGNDDYYVESDLMGATRTQGAVSIGAFEPYASSSAVSQAAAELGSFPRPSIDSYHSCDFQVKVNEAMIPSLNRMLIDCGTYHSFGKNFSALANYVRDNVHLNGKCQWATFNPQASAACDFANEMTYTTATTDWAAYSTLTVSQPFGGLTTHPSFSSQFAAGGYFLPVTFTCVEKKSQSVDVYAQDHILKWTDTAAENKKCPMVGKVSPAITRYGIPTYSTRQSMVLPYCAAVPLAVEWTGGDSYVDTPCEYDSRTPTEGALLLTHMKCTVCGSEERISPMPKEFSRMLKHACLYQTPWDIGDDFMSRLQNGHLTEDECGYIERSRYGLNAYISNNPCTYDFINIGHDTATFKRHCLPYVAKAEHWHPEMSKQLFSDIEVPKCGSAEFTYDADVIGIQDLIVAPDADAEASSLLTLDNDTTIYNANGLLLLAREVTEEESKARFRPKRPVPAVDFTALSTSGDGSLWPTPDDHPLYGDIDDDALFGNALEAKLNWRFPMWEGFIDCNEAYGEPNVALEFKEPGCCTIAAGCFDTDGCYYKHEDIIDWNFAHKSWMVATGDIRVTLNGKESPMPMLLINDNNESTCVWPNPQAIADKDQQGPIDYVDSDLKPLTVTLDNTFSSLSAEVLDKLAIRVEVQGDSIRLFEDQKKNSVGSHDTRWSSSQDTYYYALDGKLKNLCRDNIACTLYAEGLTEGTATIKATLVDKGSMDADTGISESLQVTVVRARLVPDYNCDGKIDDTDKEFASKGRILRMWTNDNGDVDKLNKWDFENGSKANCKDSVVNGRGDLLDFFPVWLDTKNFFSHTPTDAKLSVRLRHTWNKVNVVYTDLSSSSLADYMHVDNAGKAVPMGNSDEKKLHCAATYGMYSGTVPEDFLSECAAGKGVVLCEGNLESGKSCPSELVLELCLEMDGKTHILAQRALPTSISSVHDMFRAFNLRGCEETSSVPNTIQSYLPANQLAEPTNMPDAETEKLKVYFVHGFNMDQTESYNWMARLFKRLYRSGISCRFVGVDWKSDSGSKVGCYQWNVENAFRTAPFLKELVDHTSSSDEKTVFIAHSLGNMLVSSAIEDHNMKSNLFMLVNAAVAAEAYDENEYNSDETSANKMLPVEWREFAHKSRSAEWYTYHPNDNRNAITWKGRFKNVKSKAGKIFNFYDSKDEVIRVISADKIHIYTGADFWEAHKLFELTRRRLSWQKQEFFKGTYDFNALGGSNEAGWGKEMLAFYYTIGHYGEGAYYRKPTKEDSRDPNRDFSDFDQALFLHAPEMMNEPNVSKEEQNHLLAYAIPAISISAGSKSVKGFDNQMDLAAIPPKGWPRTEKFILNKERQGIEMDKDDLIWCHSDFMLVPYFYTHEMYEEMKRQIDMMNGKNNP